MNRIETFIAQVRAYLTQLQVPDYDRVSIYNQFLNECKANNLSETDFYKLVLKVAHKSIDWNYFEAEKKQKEKDKAAKEAKERAIELELAEIKKNIQHAPQFIDRLIKSAFDDNVVEKAELIRIFEKADQLLQDTYIIAEKINAQLDEKNYKAYPKANDELPSLRLTLCSTDWHSPDRLAKLMEPPKEPTPWGMIIAGIFLLVAVTGAFGYFFYLKPLWRDQTTPRYYLFAQDVTLRSTQVAGVEYNKLGTLNYGAELITYEYGNDWCKVKVDDKEGYVYTKYVLDSANFYLLNSIFGDSESKQTVASARCRRALLEYFNANNYIGVMDGALQKQLFSDNLVQKEVWQLFTKAKGVKPNTVFIEKKLANPSAKYNDFGVIIKNAGTSRRKFLLFAFNDDESPRLVFEEDAPVTGDIKDIKTTYKNGEASFYVQYTG